jgi:Zn-dependent protease with chaperone function
MRKVKKIQNKWNSSLKNLCVEFPCLITPRLIFFKRRGVIPKYSAFTFLSKYIFVDSSLQDAPDFVQEYVISHEYGHFYRKHTLIPLLMVFPLVMSLIFLQLYPNIICGVFFVLSLLLSSFYLLFLIKHQDEKFEYEADDFAAKSCPSGIALKGALWVAVKKGEMNNEVRQKRLKKLGWNGIPDSVSVLS